MVSIPTLTIWGEPAIRCNPCCSNKTPARRNASGPKQNKKIPMQKRICFSFIRSSGRGRFREPDDNLIDDGHRVKATTVMWWSLASRMQFVASESELQAMFGSFHMLWSFFVLYWWSPQTKEGRKPPRIRISATSWSGLFNLAASGYEVIDLESRNRVRFQNVLWRRLVFHNNVQAPRVSIKLKPFQPFFWKW